MGAKPESPVPEVRLVPAGTVLPVRAAVLRPGLAPDAARFPADDEPRSRHAAAFGDGGAVLAVGTLLVEDPPWPAPPGTATGPVMRIRGMATVPDHRSAGLGRAVLDTLLAEARRAGAMLVWCDARARAVPFYRRAGFSAVGDRFDVPGIGAHQAMLVAYSPTSSSEAAPA